MRRAKKLKRKDLAESKGAPVEVSSGLNKSLQPKRLARIAVDESLI